MEIIIIALILAGAAWVFRKTLKVWAERAEQISEVTSEEVYVDIQQRVADLDDLITDELITKNISAKAKLAALKAGKVTATE